MKDSRSYQLQDPGERLLKADLVPSQNLLSTFNRIHNDLYANYKSDDKRAMFRQMVYLLFCKLYDEKSTDNDQPCEFFITANELADVRESGNSESFKNRINGLLGRIMHHPNYSSVFTGKEEIEIPWLQVANVVSELQHISILDMDSKGDAFQTFLGGSFRGGRGQYFTPDVVKKLMVSIIDPSLDDVVLDPACGSGGFLTTSLKHVADKIKKSMGFVDDLGRPLKDSGLKRQNLRQVNNRLKKWAAGHILGADNDDDLVRIAKMYMLLIGDGATGIHYVSAKDGGSLKSLTALREETKGSIKNECADVILTNPPFGTKGKVSSYTIISNFLLGHRWKYNNGRWEMGEVLASNKGQGGQVPDILFIERCWELLSPGGRAAMILPKGDLNNERLEYVRNFLLERAQICGVIDLPVETFYKFEACLVASVLIFKKPKDKIPKRYPVFFSQLTKVGYDLKGRTVYKRDNMRLVLDRNDQPIRFREGKRTQSQDDIAIYGQVDTDVDDIIGDWERFRKKHGRFLW